MRANARVDLRLSEKDRERIDRAAALAGLSLAAFGFFRELGPKMGPPVAFGADFP
jgi:hypothetical protein